MSHPATPEREVAWCEPQGRQWEGEAPSEPELALGSHTGSPSRNDSELPARGIEPPSALHEIETEAGPEEALIADESSYTTSQLDDEPHMAADDASWYEAPALPPPRQSRPPRQGPPSRKRPVKEAHTPDSDRAKHAVSRGKKGRKGEALHRPSHERAASPGRSRQVGRNLNRPSNLTRCHRRRTFWRLIGPGGNHSQRACPRDDSGKKRGQPWHASPTSGSLPAWIAGPPAAVFVLAVGLAGGILSWSWTADSYSVAIMTATLDGRRSKAPTRTASRIGRAA